MNENIIIPKSHYSIKTTKDVTEIMSPLKKYGIMTFCYARCFTDGSLRILISNEELYRHHFKSGYKIAPTIHQSFNQLKTNRQYHLATSRTDEPYSKALYDYKNLFNLENVMFLIEEKFNYVDLFVYTSQANNPDIINFYLNKMDVLEKFKNYLITVLIFLTLNCLSIGNHPKKF